MSWIFLAIITAFCFGAYNVFIKVASDHDINSILGAVILQFVALLIGVGALLWVKYHDGASITVTNRGVMYSVLAGIFIGVAEILSFVVYAKGVAASTGIPVIIGGSIVAGSLLGFLFLKEILSLSHIAGIIFVVAGIVLISR